MNLFDKRNMQGESIYSKDGMCCVCHMRPASNRHHLIPRSHGGGDGPTIDVCGFGNASGCHGEFHSGRLHARWVGHWEILRTERPVKVEVAEDMEGWRRIE